MKEQFYEHLSFLYGHDRAILLGDQLAQRLAVFQASRFTARPAPAARVTEKDAILITYGDMVQAPGERPLATLADFLTHHLAGLVNAVHILPFYPYSSDDGFSVIDYQAVNPAWGGWDDVAQVGRSFRLMFDAVVNHISAESRWFQAFLRDERPYTNYFITADPHTDLSAVFRPRTHPLLTPFDTPSGRKHVWTTFSADQVDLNFTNPDVLLAMIDVLLAYVTHGAEFIRLDAIAYLWKEVGTPCLHLPQTHEVVRLMRTVLDAAAPHVSLITETNVPHADNISYFGDGSNEAQMVYNFSLPPLTLHAFHTGSAVTLSQWASTLTLPSDQVTFFNFLASHDGIGVQPARGLLPDTAVSDIATRVQALGGRVSYKTNSDGSQSPYELNCNYLEALGDPTAVAEPTALKAQRFLAAQAIMLALRGVPGIYFHSLFGSQNWPEGVETWGYSRAINRQKLQRAPLEAELADSQSLRYQVFGPYQKLLQVRSRRPAFHPNGDQQILFASEAVFALWRLSPDGRDRVLCLQNVSRHAVDVQLPLQNAPSATGPLVDLLTGETAVPRGHTLSVTLPPYAVRWLSTTTTSFQ